MLRICNDARIPVTAAAGRSGVCGASVPVHGGVLLDLCGLAGIVDVDDTSLVVDVQAGTFGTWFEDTLRAEHGVTAGHWPQSIDLSTVGGWLACRGAGQLSTRYGKIEDMVVGLDVVLADGTSLRTGGNAARRGRPRPRPGLRRLGGHARDHHRRPAPPAPAPATDRRAAYGFESFAAGLDACRRILRRGGTPAVLRLYDAVEGERNFGTGDAHPLLVLDEGDPGLVDATLAHRGRGVRGRAGARRRAARHLARAPQRRERARAADPARLRGRHDGDHRPVGRGRRASTSAATAAIGAVEHTLAASAHQSHAYTDGACLYFTFAGSPPPERREAYYRAAWDAGTRVVLAEGGALSHHHGVGLNRARFVREALGEGFRVLAAMKGALDPNGILNPGKLGLPDPWSAGDAPVWP